MNQRESETEVKTLEKRKNDNQIYYQQNKKKTILEALHEYHKMIKIWLRAKVESVGQRIIIQ